MPYRSISELPPNVRAGLPDYALETYQEVFNEVWDDLPERGAARSRPAPWGACKPGSMRKNRKTDETGGWEPVS